MTGISSGIDNRQPKPWHIVREGEWAFGHSYQCRLKYEQLALIAEYGDNVEFHMGDIGDRFIAVKNANEDIGNILIFIPDTFVMDGPVLNSVNIEAHLDWAPGRNLIDVVEKEQSLRAAAYVEDVGDAWLGDPFDMSQISGWNESASISG